MNYGRRTCTRLTSRPSRLAVTTVVGQDYSHQGSLPPRASPQPTTHLTFEGYPCDGDGTKAPLQRHGVQAEARNDHADVDQHEHRHLQRAGEPC